MQKCTKRFLEENEIYHPSELLRYTQFSSVKLNWILEELKFYSQAYRNGDLEELREIVLELKAIKLLLVAKIMLELNEDISHETEWTQIDKIDLELSRLQKEMVVN